MELSNAQGILGLIHLASRTPQSYRRIIICTPFISEDLLCNKIAPNGIVRVPTLIITCPKAAQNLFPLCKEWKGSFMITSIPSLHAKVYLACGRDERDSVAILGSFNLTNAALNGNYELGLRFVGNSPEVRKLISKMESKLILMTQRKLYEGGKQWQV
jgi:HKD family nuclease